jgi:cell division protein FtsZ
MNIFAVCEKPQVLQFKTQDVSASLKVVSANNSEEMVKARSDRPAVIKVISAGGGGGNALNRMVEANITGVEFIAVNTDIQDLLKKSKADVKLQIGKEVTGGRGAGGNPEKGEKAALEDQAAITEVIRGADMVFITAGMGGGTGTGSVPIIARIARQLGALTVAVVTMPFEFEGRYTMRLAEEGIEKLRGEVDTLIVIPNQHLFKIIDSKTTYNKAYMIADEVLCRGVQGITDIIVETGFQNTDFADVETIMKGKGDALMGIGFGTGENRAMDAVKNAIDNPLLEDTSIDGATGVLINIVGPEDITLVEIQDIIKSIKEKCDQEVHLIHGLRTDNKFENSIQITVIATGFPSEKQEITVESPPVGAMDSDFIDYNEYVKMVERTKKPDYIAYVPEREYHDEIDVPAVIRRHSYQKEETAPLETVERRV